MTPGDARCSLLTFSDTYALVYDAIPLADVPILSRANYEPGGWTALWDSLAFLIDRAGERLAAMVEVERPAKVVFLILTDGEENISKKYKGEPGRHALKKKVEHQRSKYSWEFVYIGANGDAMLASERLGMNPRNALNYKADIRGMQGAMRMTSAGTSRYRGGAAPSGGYFVGLDPDAPSVVVPSSGKADSK